MKRLRRVLLLTIMLLTAAPAFTANAVMQDVVPAIHYVAPAHPFKLTARLRQRLEPSMFCLAVNVYYESPASMEPLENQYGVALVTYNRARHRPSHICRQVFRPYQFSWTLLPQVSPHGQDWENAKKVAWDVITHKMPDFTNGAMYFYADYIPQPKWAVNMIYIAKYGHHYYLKEKEA